MQIIKENHNEADCILIQQMEQTRAGKKKGETVTYAARVVEEKRKKVIEHHEDEEVQPRQIKDWLEQTGTVTRTIPKCSEVYKKEQNIGTLSAKYQKTIPSHGEMQLFRL